MFLFSVIVQDTIVDADLLANKSISTKLSAKAGFVKRRASKQL
jgi:hypothetical protein